MTIRFVVCHRSHELIARHVCSSLFLFYLLHGKKCLEVGGMLFYIVYGIAEFIFILASFYSSCSSIFSTFLIRRSSTISSLVKMLFCQLDQGGCKFSFSSVLTPVQLCVLIPVAILFFFLGLR